MPQPPAMSPVEGNSRGNLPSRPAGAFCVLLVDATDAAAAAAVAVAAALAYRSAIHPTAIHVLDFAPESGRTSDVIVERASTLGADLVILGRQYHPGATAANVPDTVRGVAVHAGVPVLAVHPDLPVLPRRAVVAIDFHHASLSAATLACRLVEPDGLVYLVHVLPASSAGGHTQSVAAAFGRLTRHLASLCRATVCTVVLRGEAVPELSGLLDRVRPDLIAFGTQGGRGKRSERLGVVADTLLTSPVPASVLLVPLGPLRLEHRPR